MTDGRGLVEEGLWPDNDGPDEEDYEGPNEPETWSTYRITCGPTFEDKCQTHWATNDDDDDGWPADDDAASTTYHERNVWEALRFTNGGSRIGYGGCRVSVYLGGSLIYTSAEDWKNYRPYCKWPRKEGR